MSEAIRPWCAKAIYPGLKPFIGGTVILPANAQAHEVMAALEAHFHTFLPAGFEIIESMCGAIFFSEHEE